MLIASTAAVTALPHPPTQVPPQRQQGGTGLTTQPAPRRLDRDGERAMTKVVAGQDLNPRPSDDEAASAAGLARNDSFPRRLRTHRAAILAEFYPTVSGSTILLNFLFHPLRPGASLESSKYPQPISSFLSVLCGASSFHRGSRPWLHLLTSDPVADPLRPNAAATSRLGWSA
jgi:hypothetical protein